MVKKRSTTPTRRLQEFKQDFNRVITQSSRQEDKDYRTPLQLLVIATYLNRLNFIDYINTHLTWDKTQWKHSPGVLAQLLVLLPFLSSHGKVPLSRIHEAYADIDLELLVGEPLDPAELNDDQFGRLLDRIHASGCATLFSSLALTVRLKFDLPENYVLHSDTTSHILYGDYRTEAGAPAPPLLINYGYSKDKRKDLKQIMTGMVTDGDGLVKFCRTLDGNTADCDYNHKQLQILQEFYGPRFQEYVYIADSKLLNEPNLRVLMAGDKSVPFISRVPESFHKKLAERMRTLAFTKDEWLQLGQCCESTPGSDSPFYDAMSIPVDVFGMSCYAHVIRKCGKSAKVEEKIAAEKEVLLDELKKITKKRFVCEPDAVREMAAFMKTHSDGLVHPVLSVESDVTMKQPRGRPGKTQKIPNVVTQWRIGYSGISLQSGRIQEETNKLASFILLTNIHPDKKSSREILLQYKSQSKVERNFTLLKDPLVAATIFLEKVERIDALMCILYFSVLMHGIIRVITRIELAQEIVPPRINSNNRQLIRPSSDTMIWILSLFTVISNQDRFEIVPMMRDRGAQLPLILRLVRFDPDFM